MSIRLSAGVLVVIGLAAPRTAPAECRSSASGAASADLRPSLRSGRACLVTVAVFEGGTCGPGEPRWTTDLGCSEAARMVPTDRSRLVSLLARRASRRDWEIISVFAHEEGHTSVSGVRLQDLPGLPATARRPRLRLDAGALHVEVDPPIEIPIAVIESLAIAPATSGGPGGASSIRAPALAPSLRIAELLGRGPAEVALGRRPGRRHGRWIDYDDGLLSVELVDGVVRRVRLRDCPRRHEPAFEDLGFGPVPGPGRGGREGETYWQLEGGRTLEARASFCEFGLAPPRSAGPPPPIGR